MKSNLRRLWGRLPYGWRYAYHYMLRSLHYGKDFDRYAKTIDIDHMPLFRAVEIETVNRCNGRCSFCPVNVNEKQREYAKMTESLFLKIIGELKELNYSGCIALFSNNEPFLDERMFEWNRIARQSLPGAHLYLYTNGSLLDEGKAEEILELLDELVIDDYGQDPEREVLFERIREIGARKNKPVTVYKRSAGDILTSRGGQAPNKRNRKALRDKCFYPFQQLIIRPDGKVSLCCNDALGKYTLGDCTGQTLTEIWNGGRYREIRAQMLSNGRKDLALCQSCDTRDYAFRSFRA